MECSHCGRSINSWNRFCTKCGGENKNVPEYSKFLKDYQAPAGFLIKLGAFITDIGFVAIVLVLPICLIIREIALSNSGSDKELWNLIPAIYALSVVIFLIYYFESFSLKSTTFGRWLFGISIIRINNKNLAIKNINKSMAIPLIILVIAIAGIATYIFSIEMVQDQNSNYLYPSESINWRSYNGFCCYADFNSPPNRTYVPLSERTPIPILGQPNYSN